MAFVDPIIQEDLLKEYDKPLPVNKKGNVGDINSDAKGSGARFNAGKPPMELIPVGVFAKALEEKILQENGFISPIHDKVLEILKTLGDWQADNIHISKVLAILNKEDWIECAKVFDYGRKKYAEWNWAKGMKWSIPVACIMRHAQAIMLDDQWVDEESTFGHIGHIACNLVMLAQFTETFPEGDDRPIKYLKKTIEPQ